MTGGAVCREPFGEIWRAVGKERVKANADDCEEFWVKKGAKLVLEVSKEINAPLFP
jgi:hypothetical protein